MTIIIWGTTFVSTKVLLEAFTPIEILFFRFTLGYFSLWAIYPRKGACGTLRQEMFFAAAGLCGVTLYFLLENIALTYTFASNVGSSSQSRRSSPHSWRIGCWTASPCGNDFSFRVGPPR